MRSRLDDMDTASRNEFFDRALTDKVYRVVRDPSGDFRPGACLGSDEIEIMMRIGTYPSGMVVRNTANKKAYIVQEQEGRYRKAEIHE